MAKELHKQEKPELMTPAKLFNSGLQTKKYCETQK